MSRARRQGLAVGLLVAAFAIVVVVVGSRGFDPPPDRAASLVPDDAFLYLHLAAGDDDQQERAGGLVERIQGLRRLRDGLLERASVSGGNFDFDSDVLPWLGDEAAAALVGATPGDAQSLLLLEAADEDDARAFMRGLGETRPTSYRGTEILEAPDVASALVDGFVLVAPIEVLRRALDVRAGEAPALADDPRYRGLRGGLPPERLVDAYASKPGLAALLAGRAAPLAELPGVARLEAGALGFSVSEQRAQLSFRGVSPPDAGCGAPAGGQAAAEEAPADSLVYVEAPDAACILRDLVRSPDSSLGSALRELATSIGRETDVDLARDLLPLLDDLATLTLTRAGEDPPVATLVARGNPGDEAVAVLNRLQPVLVGLARSAGAAQPSGGRAPDDAEEVLNAAEAGRTPRFEVREVGGLAAVTAALAPGIQLSYAALDDSLIVSTALAGIDRAQDTPEAGLAGTDDFDALLGDRPNRTSPVVFLDLDKLLVLGDQIGLAQAPGYATARDDLQTIGAAAAIFSREGDQTRVELLFKSR